MCGICGVFPLQENPSVDGVAIELMTKSLMHRGPDNSKFLAEEEISLGNVRLAIVDPRAESDQPMEDQSNSTLISYNGEIYNYKALREELINKGLKFRTDSDTEVVLKGITSFGPSFLNKMNGMWAIAVYDRKQRQLFLSRDRFGKKPLYWTKYNSKIYFSSEMKSFLNLGIHLVPNENYIYRYLINNGVDSGSETPFLNVYSLPAGSNLTADKKGNVNIVKWWDTTAELTEKPYDQVWRDDFQEIFQDSVAIRVPEKTKYAISLSAGLDSNSILGATVRHINSLGSQSDKSTPLPFIVQFPDSAVDESKYAIESCRLFKLTPNLVTPSTIGFRQRVSKAIWHQESLVWNASLLSFDSLYDAISQQGIKVVLEGHGSDEYIGGYPHFARQASFHSLSRLNLINTIKMRQNLAKASNPAIQEKSNVSWYREVSYFLREYTSHIIRNSFDRNESSFIAETFGIHFKKGFEFQKESYVSRFGGIKGDLDQAFHFQILPQVLRVFDKAPMAYGVESRAPFMDYRLVQHVFSLSSKDLSNEIGTKPLIRNDLSDFLPKHVVENKIKRGFSGDIQVWFNNVEVVSDLESIMIDGTIDLIPGIETTVYERIIKSAKQRQLTQQECGVVWKIFSLAIWYSLFDNSRKNPV